MVARQLRRVRFLLGRAGSGKTFRCLQEIREQARQRPLGPPLILLVPEQATYQMDRALLEGGSLQATLRCQVLSFRRLAYLVLEEHLHRRRVISDIGRQMVVQALLHRYRTEWCFFDTSRLRPGLATRLSRTLRELRQYRVTPEMLQRVVQSLMSVHGPDSPLVRKLTDLTRLAVAYQEFLAQNCYDGDEIAAMLSQAIRQTTWLHGAKLWVDSFGDFTRQEYETLQALLDVVQEATFSLCLDPRVLEESDPALGTVRLFHRAEETYRRLRQLVPGQARVELVYLPQDGICPRFRCVDLVRIEQEMFADLVSTSSVAETVSSVPLPATTSSHPPLLSDVTQPISNLASRGASPCVTLVEASNRRAEVEYVARTIRRLVMDEGWRYRQIAVIVRELEDYRALIEAVFPDYGIPFFTDQRRSVRHHPVVELVRSALRVALDNWRRADVVRWLRTGFAANGSERSDVREIIDRLEQHADEHGLDGPVWRARQWRIRQPPGDNLPQYLRPEILNRERLRLTEPLAEFCSQALGELATDGSHAQQEISVRQVLLALWQMLQRLKVSETLQSWHEQARSAGKLDEAAEHVQVWESLLELLEEVDMALGTSKLPLSDLVAVLETGLDGLTVGIVPPALDEVLIGAIERSRQPELRGVFLLGMNEGVFPRLGEDDPVLNDRDRRLLQEHNIELAPSSEARHFQEQYLGYIAFTRASERLWVSYALTDESNHPLLPSSFVERLRRLFPDLQPQRADAAPQLTEPSTVLTWYELASALAVHGHPEANLQPTPPETSPVSSTAKKIWEQLREELSRYPDIPTVLRLALQARHYHHRVALPAPLAQQLFLTGNELRLTVSELESYAWCPFQFFASSGLRLRPRQSFRLSRQDLGQLLHRILQHFMKRYVIEFPYVSPVARLEDSSSATAESEEERQQRLQKVLTEVAEAVIQELDDDRFDATARRKYIQRQACRILSDYVLALDQQLRAGKFIPHKCELPFGSDETGSALLTVELGDASQLCPCKSWILVPRGRLDRVDAVPRNAAALAQGITAGLEPSGVDERPQWVRVVDYKLSPSRANLDRIYYGLDLQLMVYLLVARQLYGPETQLAGTFYAPLRRHPHSVSSPSKVVHWKDWLRGYRLRGVLVEDAITLFDPKKENGWSPFVQVFRKKDGSFGNQAKSDTVDSGVLQALVENTRARIRTLSERILQGEIAVRPVRHRQEIPCTLCALSSVCRFDRTWNRYRHLQTLNKEEVIQRLGNH